MPQFFFAFLGTFFIATSAFGSPTDFGKLPSAYFGPQGTIPCDKASDCPVPSREQLVKIGEEFIMLASKRMDTLKQIEVEVRNRAFQIEEWAVAHRAKNGNGPFPKLLDQLSQSLIDTLEYQRHSDLLHSIGGRSQFMQELTGLTRLLSEYDGKIAAETDPLKKDLLEQEKRNRYRQARLSGQFESYLEAEMAKGLVVQFQQSGVASILPDSQFALDQRFIKSQNCDGRDAQRALDTLSKIDLSPNKAKGFKRRHLNIFDAQDRQLLAEALKARPLVINCQNKSHRYLSKENQLNLAKKPLKGQKLLEYLGNSLSR